MLAVTGANGHLGQRLLAAMATEAPMRAIVRSSRAVAQVAALGLGNRVESRIVDYGDADGLAAAVAGCSAVVHLVGILREDGANTYQRAHEDSCRALAEAAERAGIARIVYLSILGATPAAGNDCLASKGRAEQILGAGAVAATVIRVPMVLGENDYASTALSVRARRGCNVLLRASSLEQPIYAGDVIEAIRSVLRAAPADAACDLAGPESLSRGELTRRAARVLGRRTRVVSVPLGLGLLMAAICETLLSRPPVTRAMLEVLDHDDCIDTRPALAALGLALTPLDATLRRCLGVESGPAA